MVWTINGEAEQAGSTCAGRSTPGTIGMMRAVAWNIRTRVFVPKGEIICPAQSGVCFNYAKDYKLTVDFNSVYKRYWGVIETGGYAGLTKGIYTAKSEQVFYDVFYGRVPDPIAGKCLYGSMIGKACDGACTQSSAWWSFQPYVSAPEFRAGKIVNWYDWGINCYKFVPMMYPSNPAYCGLNCYSEKGPICPVNAQTGDFLCYSDARRYYYYDGPCYGNIFFKFNMLQ